MMKRLIPMLLTCVLLLSLSACGGGAPAATPAPAAGAARAADSAPAQVTDNAPAKAAEISIAETVILDEQGIRVTARELNAEGTFGPEIKLLIENDSGADLTFQCRGASVNGYMVEPMMSVDVANGKKANDKLTFTNSDLKQCGIETIANLCFSLHIFYSDSWENFMDTPEIELRTNQYEGYAFQFDDAGTLAYDENGVKIVVKGVSEDGSWFGPSVMVFIQNNTGRMITVQARNLSVNGFMVEPVFSSDVAAGKAAIDGITLMSDDLEANGIQSIDEVELSFHVFYEDTWENLCDTPSMAFSFG